MSGLLGAMVAASMSRISPSLLAQDSNQLAFMHMGTASGGRIRRQSGRIRPQVGSIRPQIGRIRPGLQCTGAALQRSGIKVRGSAVLMTLTDSKLLVSYCKLR